MRRILSFVLVFAMIVGLFVFSVTEAGAAVSGNYTYEVYEDNKIIITGYADDGAKKLVIPSAIDGYKVTAIDDYAFEEIVAEEIILPDTLEYIGTLAFFNTYATTIHIPKNVEDIGVASFCGADFVSFTVDKDNEFFKAVDGVLYTKDGSVIVSYPCGKTEKKYTILAGTEYIYYGAFFCSYNLTNVKMPEGLLGIMSDSFSGCTSIASVDIPATVEYVGDYAFNQCTSLKEINVLGGDIEYVSSTAFKETLWLDKHPSGVVYLGTMAYSYRRTAIVGEVAEIREGTTRICEKAFAGADSPYTVNIPASVEYIDLSAFFEPYSLRAINVHGDNKYFSSSEGILCSKDMKILYTYPAANDSKTAIIPEGVEVIYEYAFRRCPRLKEIICPESLVVINDRAFVRCGNLSRIEFKGDIQYVGNGIFEDSPNVAEVVIPQGCIAFSCEDFENTIWFKRLTGKQIICVNGSVIGGKDVSNVGIINLPKDSVSVGEMAFANYKSLKSVVFPDSMRRIGPCAFENCPKLKEVTIPASVDEIYPFALGYTYVEGENGEEGEHFPVEGFVIKGYSNSQAEAYAIENGFEFVAIGEIEVSKLLGDTDLDEVVTIKDATAIQKYLASLQLFVTQQKKNADMNSDGDVNIKDATAIQKNIAGLEY